MIVFANNLMNITYSYMRETVNEPLNKSLFIKIRAKEQ